MLRLLWKWVAATFSVVIILLAIAMGLFRLILPTIPQHHERIEAFASEAAGTPVRIREISARWRLGGPELRFSDARLLTADSSETLLEAQQGSIVIDAGALLRGRLRAGQVQLDGLRIRIERDAEGRWLVAGRLLDGRDETTLTRLSLGLRDAEIEFVDAVSGAGPWVFEDVELDVDLRPGRLTIGSQMKLPAGLGREAEISLQSEGEISDFDNLDWQLYTRVEDIELFGWRALMPAGRVVPTAGRGDLVLWFGARGNEVEQISLQSDLRDLELSRDEELLRELDRLGGRIEYDRMPGGWYTTGRDLQVAAAGHEWPLSSFTFEKAASSSGDTLLYADIDYARLQDFAPLLDWIPDPDLRQRLGGLDPRGEIENLSVRASRHDGAAESFSVRGSFAGLGFNATGKLPGFDNLSGELRVEDNGGNLQLKPQPVRIELPEVLGEPLQTERLSGAVVWRRSPGGWRVVSDHIDIEHAQFVSATSFELAVPDERPALLDLRSRFEKLSFAAVRELLPEPVMAEQTLNYLRESLVGGEIPNLSVVFTGAPSAFPFDNGEGEFYAVAEVRDAEVAYARDWPVATQVNGTVEFRNAGFSAGVSSAQISGNRITSAEMEIEDFRRSVLQLHGEADGLLENLHDFLLQSPLATRGGTMLEELDIAGDGNVQLDLVLPLSRKVDRAMDVLVIVSSKAGSATLQGLDEPLQAISGSLQYRNGEFSGRNIDARFLDAPVSIDVNAQRMEAGDETYQATVATLRGSVAGRELARIIPDYGQYFEGVTSYTAAVVIPAQQAQRSLSVGIASRLEGMAVRLPQPLGKRRNVSRDLVIDLVLPPGSAQTDVAYADVARARINWLREQGWSIERGGIMFGTAQPELPSGPGLAVAGRTGLLDLSGFLELAAAHSDGTGEDNVLRSVAVTADRLRAFGEEARDARLVVDRSDREWLVQVDSDIAAGAVFVPYQLEGNEIVANMQKLYIGTREAAAQSDDEEQRDPRDIPAVTVQADDFRLGDMHLGRLEASLVRDADGILAEEFATQSPSFSIRGSGNWEITQAGQRTEMNFNLASDNFNKTLEQLGFDPIIDSSSVNVAAALNWPGPPGGDFRRNLNGVVEISVGAGQINTVNPGAGRALGLLSFTALPRRMSLDFRDVFDKGFGFDYIEGDFTLDSGDAYTSNLILEGPAAQVGIAGRTGLATRDYDQTAVVYGNFGAALPVAGAIAGGPVGGAAMLIFSELFKRPLQNMARINYRITGSWDDPQIERVIVATESEGSS